MTTLSPPWERPALDLPYNYACNVCECTQPEETLDTTSGNFVMLWARCSRGHLYMLDQWKVTRQ